MNSSKHIPTFSFVQYFLPVCYMFLALFPFAAISSAGAQMRPIIAYGDSLTAGCWNTEPEESSCGITPRPGFVSHDYGEQLQTLIHADGYNYQVHNFGKGGETTTDALDFRFDAALNNSCNDGAKFILILHGTNDLLHRDSKYNIKFNLDIMIEKSLAKDLVPLVATLPPDLTPGHEYKGIPEMNTLIRQLVYEKVLQEKNVELVDLYAALAPFWSTYTNPRSCYALFNPEDQLHPNELGTSVMGTVWYESLAPLLAPKGLPWLMLLLADR
jgi:lysophospholipase L1-like esterase